MSQSILSRLDELEARLAAAEATELANRCTCPRCVGRDRELARIARVERDQRLIRLAPDDRNRLLATMDRGQRNAWLRTLDAVSCRDVIQAMSLADQDAAIDALDPGSPSHDLLEIERVDYPRYVFVHFAKERGQQFPPITITRASATALERVGLGDRVRRSGDECRYYPPEVQLRESPRRYTVAQLDAVRRIDPGFVASEANGLITHVEVLDDETCKRLALQLWSTMQVAERAAKGHAYPRRTAA